jgi:hypothetical protein
MVGHVILYRHAKNEMQRKFVQEAINVKFARIVASCVTRDMLSS